MTEQLKTTAAKPTHRIYLVTGEGKDAKWKEFCSAWPHRDGNGFSIDCATVPEGRFVMRKITERQAKAEQA